MIIKSNILIKIITFGFAKGITLWPFIILRKDATWIDINHERIHAAQQKELFIIGFYLWYLIEWVIKRSYYNISFEREAYRKDMYRPYLKERKHYSFIKYLKNA
jgi:hypothetical protein